MFRSMILLIITAMPFIVMADQLDAGDEAPDFSLMDQFDTTYSLEDLRGNLVILIASDKEGSVQNKLWRKKLGGLAGDIHILGVADLRSVPFFLKWKIRSDFRKDKAPILLDWDGDIFKDYGLVQKVSNIVLIDKGGFIRHHVWGEAGDDAVQTLLHTIDSHMHSEGSRTSDSNKKGVRNDNSTE